MISKISEKFVAKWLLSDSVDADEKELYEYGIFILLSTIFFAGITAILGTLFGLFIQSLLFFAVFVTVRQFAGGIHASSEIKCEVFTSISILLCIVTMHLAQNNDLIIGILLLLALIFSALIFICAPIDSEEKTLNKAEFKAYRKRTRLILLFVLMALIVSFCLTKKEICIPCCMSLILEGVLLSAGKIQKTNIDRIRDDY